jgi:hypothetical protein
MEGSPNFVSFQKMILLFPMRDTTRRFLTKGLVTTVGAGFEPLH